jgi:hypothetical protein
MPLSVESIIRGSRDLKRRLSSFRRLSSTSDDSSISRTIQGLEALLLEAQDLERSSDARKRRISADLTSFDGMLRLDTSVMSPNPPWRARAVERIDTPAMISNEEARYYDFIGAFYGGLGRALELGPWLGASTQYIVRGLSKNPRFIRERLHVVDDFVWRAAWMNQHVRPDERLPDHTSFRHLFDKYTGHIQDQLAIQHAKLTTYDGNENVPQFSWQRDPIEFLYVDCGRTWDANEAWYRLLQPFFIPDRTLIMMQDWRLHRERPRKWYNQTLQFTESKTSVMELIHEVTDGGLATFLYRR